MAYTQLSLQTVVVNRIRSRLQTLDGYRRTSRALHGRPLKPVILYARSLLEEVEQIRGEWSGDPEIERWAKKVHEYVEQHELVESSTE